MERQRSCLLKALLLALIAAGLVGCGGEVTAPIMLDANGTAFDLAESAPDLVEETHPELAILPSDVLDLAAETLGDGELLAEVDVGIPLGEFGAPCEENADCYSGYCILTPDGKVCTQHCVDECPEEWQCVQDVASRPDLIYVCVPEFALLCVPCTQHADCNAGGLETGAGCVDFGALGGYCGAQCESIDDCPASYDCTEVDLYGGGSGSQCVRLEGECECSQLAVVVGAGTDCVNENEFGGCPGQVVCVETGPVVCEGPVPEAEVCDGQDNDCDGFLDEELGETTCGLGLCEHTVLNCADGQPVECDPLEGAQGEDCDGKDDNCDGVPDEGFPDTDDDGVADCVSIDDDGDGIPDDEDNCPLNANPDQANFDLDTVGDECDPDDDNDLTKDEDDCEPFNPAVHPNAMEFCNGVDDNCDLEVDEGFGETGCGMGECEHTVANCEDGKMQVCNPLEGALPEECDGLDNDCDGDADEGYPNADGDGLADCADDDDDNDLILDVDDNCHFTANPDQLDTDLDGFGDACDFGCYLENVESWEEDCDGVPDDIDNCVLVANPDQSDVDLDGKGDACDDDDDNDGVPDEIDNCQSVKNPGQADFDKDGVGDACDGDIDGDDVPDEDDNCPGIPNQDQDDFDQDDEGDACDTDDDNDGEPDVVDCEPMDPAVTHLAEESCNNIDDDCDGNVDEEDAAGCEDYLLDLDQDGYGVEGQSACLCKPGELYSTQEAGDCEPLATAVHPTAVEACNGIDDDCNDKVDEGYPDLDQDDEADCVDPDDDGDGVADVTDNCPVDVNEDQANFDLDNLGNVCDDDDDNDGSMDVDDCAPFDADAFPGHPEVCDGKDNDCNQEEDDGLGSTACGLGECEHTVENCVNGLPQSCDPFAGQADEVCDGKDNDCNGIVDEESGSTTCGLGECEHTVDNCFDGMLQVCDPMEGSVDEVCDKLDNNCNGEVDEGVGGTFYLDEDKDGFGLTDSAVQACEAPPGYAAESGDCDDDDLEVFPGADEVVNGKDDNCDGEGFHGDHVADASGDFEGKSYEFTTLTVDAGVNLTVTGGQFLKIYVLGLADVKGSVDLNGGKGEDEQCGLNGYKQGGPGGGGGGYAGGKGGVHNGQGTVSGTSGSGPGGGLGGKGDWVGGGGGGAGYAGKGAPGEESWCPPSRCGSYVISPGGDGGPSYSAPDLTNYDGGSGGGGGAGAKADNGRGGGGGGGGGVFFLQADVLEVSGSIVSNGGAGGSNTDGCDGGSGGGGSGGTIWLRGKNVTITGQVTAKGGVGGTAKEGPSPGKPGPGGKGADGRIRIDTLQLEGTTDPAPYQGDY